MARPVLIAILTLSLLITAVLIMLYRNAVQAETAEQTELATEQLADSGTDFLVEGKGARASLTVEPLQVGLSSSATAVLRLTPIAAAPGLGNEHDGALLPTLQAADCAVQAPPDLSKSTKLVFPTAFVWQWSVTCANEGRKDIQLTLAFISNGPPNDSDPVAYRTVRHFDVTNSPGARILAALSAAGGLAALISAAALVFDTIRKYRSNAAN